jgi:hypothetical protein
MELKTIRMPLDFLEMVRQGDKIELFKLKDGEAVISAAEPQISLTDRMVTFGFLIDSPNQTTVTVSVREKGKRACAKGKKESKDSIDG